MIIALGIILLIAVCVAGKIFTNWLDRTQTTDWYTDKEPWWGSRRWDP